MTAVNAEMDAAEKDKLMGQAYSAAQKDLREAHKDEFNGYYSKQCAARGIQWTPRKSKEEAALDQITELLGQFPDIAEKLAERLTHGDLSVPTKQTEDLR